MIKENIRIFCDLVRKELYDEALVLFKESKINLDDTKDNNINLFGNVNNTLLNYISILAPANFIIECILLNTPKFNGRYTYLFKDNIIHIIIKDNIKALEIVDTTKEYCVYVHRRNDNGCIFYVGEGKGDRYKKSHGRSIEWEDIAETYGFTYEIVDVFSTKKEAVFRERQIIRELIDMKISLVNKNIDEVGSYSKAVMRRRDKLSESLK